MSQTVPLVFTGSIHVNLCSWGCTMLESKKDLKQRLQDLGLWTEFLVLRERLKSEGLDPAAAREKAARLIDERMPHQPSKDVQDSVSDRGGIRLDPSDDELRAWRAAAAPSGE